MSVVSIELSDNDIKTLIAGMHSVLVWRRATASRKDAKQEDIEAVMIREKLLAKLEEALEEAEKPW